MKISRYLGALAFVGAVVPHVSLAAPPPVISQSVAVCNPNAPSQCAAPNSSGALPVSLSSTAGATTIIVPTGQIANGLAPVASTATESSGCKVFKAAPGLVYSLSGYVGAATLIEVLNVSTAPTGTGTAVTPVAWVSIGTAGTWSLTYSTGAPGAFTNGITVCATTTANPFTFTAYTGAAFSGLFE